MGVDHSVACALCHYLCACNHIRVVDGHCHILQERIRTRQLRANFAKALRRTEVQERGIAVTGRETFDQNPELIPFEGYLTRANEAYSERRK